MCSVRPPAIDEVSCRTVSRMKRVRITTRASFVTSAALDTCPGASRPSGRTKCVSCRPSAAAFAFIMAAKAVKSGATESASASAASFADWISAALTRSRIVKRSPPRRPTVDSPTAAARGSTTTTSESLWCSKRDEHRHQLRDRRDRQPRVRPRRQRAPRRCGRPGRCRHCRRPRAGRQRAAKGQQRGDERCEQERACHRSRIFSPMKSVVEDAFGIETLDRRHGDTGLGRDDAERVAGLNRPECLRRHGRRRDAWSSSWSRPACG